MRTVKDLLKKAGLGTPQPPAEKIPTEQPPAAPAPTLPGVGKGGLDETRKPKPVPLSAWQKMGLSRKQ